MDQNPQIIFSWKAPLRAYKTRGKNILRFYLAVSLLLSLIVFFFGDKILIIPILTLFFLFYILTITPPPEVENKITPFGLETAGITLRWEAVSHFYFTKKFRMDILTLVSHPPFSYHAYLVIPSNEVKKKVIELLTQQIIYVEKPQRSFTDKIIGWFSNLIPDDEENSNSVSAVLQKLKASSL